MYKSYHKKVDRSMMDWGFTIPKEFIEEFEGGSPIELGSSRDVEILWGKKYRAKLYHENIKNREKAYKLRWDGDKDLLNKIRKTFIQSYIVLKSQKELFDKSPPEEKGKKFRTKLLGGQQEVLRVQPINKNQIKFDVFIRIENEWNELFQRLAEANVFGWLFDKSKEYLISKSTKWIKVNKFQEHANTVNIIYYLANTKKKTLYVGKSSKEFGTRVTPGKKHQDMDGDWDLFKYDIVHLEFASLLERIEEHTIRSVASILKNEMKYPNLELSTYKLVNKKVRKL